MALDVTAGMLAILALQIGLKVAVYTGVAILVLLISIIAKKGERHWHGLFVTAIAFIGVALAEFFHILATAHHIFLALASHEVLKLVTNSLFIVGAAGLIWFLWEIDKSIKAHK